MQHLAGCEKRLIDRAGAKPARPLLRQAAVLFSSLVTLIALARASPAQGQVEDAKNRVVYGGIAVEFTLEQAHPEAAGTRRGVEGGDYKFRFSITETATGSPLRGVRPAAWMNLRPHNETAGDRNCLKKVAAFIGGSLLTRPALDLNTYYILSLNHDSTITVADPRFGFGGSRLLAMVFLKSPGDDWVMTSDRGKLLVSLPDSDQVAVVNTASWKVITGLDITPRPSRLALQPDGKYAWVALGGAAASGEETGIAAIDTEELRVAARFRLGRGQHDIAFSSDSRFVFVTSKDEGAVSILDAKRLEKIADIKTGGKPSSIAYSASAQMAYVSNEADGSIAAIDPLRRMIVARLQAEPGIGQVRFAPGGRLGFVVNTSKDLVHIFDASVNRIVQTADITGGPDQITFTDQLAYVRRRASEIVLMIPLDQVGVAGRPVPIVDFPGGQVPFGKISRPALADTIVQAPGATAVLVANPADRTIYYYKEGMAAPMGSFSNYSREPRAVLALDRSLQEQRPGVYETVAKLPGPGLYDLAFFLDSPRLAHCFELSVEAREESAAAPASAPVVVLPLMKERVVQVGERVRLQFKLIDAKTGEAKMGLRDVRVLTFLSPGIWRKMIPAEQVGGGVYEVEFAPPQSGYYYLFLESMSLGLRLNNAQYLILEAKSSS